MLLWVFCYVSVPFVFMLFPFYPCKKVSEMKFSFISTNKTLSLWVSLRDCLSQYIYLYMCKKKNVESQCLHKCFNSADIFKICMVKMHSSLADWSLECAVDIKKYLNYCSFILLVFGQLQSSYLLVRNN